MAQSALKQAPAKQVPAKQVPAKQVPAKQVPAKTYVISLENRKARGCGHERPEEILCAARQLFLEHGVENVSTRQIAARVGISQTALYVYFKNKEEMLDQLSNAALCKLGAGLQKVDAECCDPIEYLRRALGGYVRFGLEHPDEYRLAFMLRDGHRKADGIDHKASPVGKALFVAMANRIAEGVAAGKLRSAGKTPDGIAQSVWAAIHGLVSLRLAYPDFDWLPIDDQIDLHIDMLLRGLMVEAEGRSQI
jgi:AcrR family transcriptional regulator